MNNMNPLFSTIRLCSLVLVSIILSSCQSLTSTGTLSSDSLSQNDPDFDYQIGPGDRLNVFVWRNPDVSANSIPVMPDG